MLGPSLAGRQFGLSGGIEVIGPRLILVAHATFRYMPVTPARAKKLALSLEGASERPHFDRTAIRTPRKTFATLAGDGADINLMFDTEFRDFYCEQAPHAFSPVPGGWGRMGATRCDLKKVDEATLHSALKAAHALAAPEAKRRGRSKPQSSQS